MTRRHRRSELAHERRQRHVVERGEDADALRHLEETRAEPTDGDERPLTLLQRRAHHGRLLEQVAELLDADVEVLQLRLQRLLLQQGALHG